MGVTRDDVARLAGVSPATVSYVVNNGPRPVATATRARVLAAIEQLGYNPSAIARSLKTQKTNSVGIIISDLANPYLVSIAQTAQDALLKRGYSLTACNSNELPERELAWLHMLRHRRVDGLILLPTGSNLHLLSSMMASGLRLVLIDRQVPELLADTVLLDNEGGAYAAVRHLIGLGHQRIALLGLPHSLTPGSERLAGYARALAEAGLPVAPELIREGTFSAEHASELVGDLLDTRPAPTAILACSNRLARGVLQQCKQRRLSMPDDLALFVFDEVDYYAWVTPSVSSIEVSGIEVGQRAVSYVISRLDGSYSGPPRLARIPYRLHPRESTDAVHRG
jgi:LacI family transcriptional regulator